MNDIEKMEHIISDLVVDTTNDTINHAINSIEMLFMVSKLAGTDPHDMRDILINHLESSKITKEKVLNSIKGSESYGKL